MWQLECCRHVKKRHKKNSVTMQTSANGPCSHCSTFKYLTFPFFAPSLFIYNSIIVITSILVAMYIILLSKLRTVSQVLRLDCSLCTLADHIMAGRGCHRFINPHKLWVQVGTGVGAGLIFRTLMKPVPVGMGYGFVKGLYITYIYIILTILLLILDLLMAQMTC